MKSGYFFLSIMLLSVILIFSCKPSLPSKEELGVECDQESNFGNVKICMPKIKGMTDYYHYEKEVTEYADAILPQDNQILFYYLETFMKQKDLRDVLSWTPLTNLMEGDFILVYSLDAYKRRNMRPSEFADIKENFGKGQKMTKWKDILKEFKNNPETRIYNRPMLFKDYSLDEESRSFISIQNTKTIVEKKLYLQASTIANIKGKLIVLTYFTILKDKNTYKYLKDKHDKIATEFIVLNQ